MPELSIFSEAGWDGAYQIRAAINSDDAERFGELSEALSHEVAVQVTMIGESLLRTMIDNDPTPGVLAGAAAVLAPHMRRFLGSSNLLPVHAEELIRTELRLQECPPWASRAQAMMFFFGFLAPVDDAAFMDFRLRGEPLWAKAIEDHLR
ncbi:hypothetical protein QSJ18_13400 [Gordonia sp. ABSL1-1]|uniref:hypothetical protein n=1 Tax=Gordonia sp. ABSL1-1 TaxID=3053923 RepID=UPI002573FD99|nr:hypothetical protein [Gordonia sp. ABSL1-1]MDL9937743.1 hypothetical protein [Gordonia sp. ABSL1-1]